MNTLFETRQITELNGKLHKVFEHNGKKFCIDIYGMGGNFIGTNLNCCLKVMIDDGTFKVIEDNQSLGFSFNNDKLMYGRDVPTKEILINEYEKKFMDYVAVVY